MNITRRLFGFLVATLPLSLFGRDDFTRLEKKTNSSFAGRIRYIAIDGDTNKHITEISFTKSFMKEHPDIIYTTSELLAEEVDQNLKTTGKI